MGPREADPFTIGFAEAIVGEEGLEVLGYVVTRNEILELVRYWATEIFQLDFAYFLYFLYSEWRTYQYSQPRLNTISELIGGEKVAEACRQAEQAFSRRVDERAWRIFTEGTQEEREQFQKEMDEKMAQQFR